MTKKLKNEQSFTLVEVLVFLTILSLFFITVSAITTYSLRNLKTQENKMIATNYAQQLLEWLRGQKEKDWNEFAKKSSTTGITYCFNNNLSLDSNFPTSGRCNNYNLDLRFKREATLTNLTNNPVAKIKLGITVKWQEGNNIFSVPLDTIFSIWE